MHKLIADYPNAVAALFFVTMLLIIIRPIRFKVKVIKKVHGTPVTELNPAVKRRYKVRFKFIKKDSDKDDAVATLQDHSEKL